jgi:hypothetical protein
MQSSKIRYQYMQNIFFVFYKKKSCLEFMMLGCDKWDVKQAMYVKGSK